MHAGSFAVFFVVIGIAIAGCLRPKLFGFIFREFAQRKYFIVGGVFLGLLCGTVYTATQPDYSSYESSISKQAYVQTPTALPNPDTNASNRELPEASPKDTSQATPSSSSAAPTNPAPASGPQPAAPAPKPAGQQDLNTESDARKKCKMIQVSFVCL